MPTSEKELIQELVSFISAAAQARQVLSQFRGMEIEAIDIQNALTQVLQAKDEYDLLHRGLSGGEIIALLLDFDFRIFHPEVTQLVILSESILPENIPRLLTEQTVKVKGEVWRIHQDDKDPFPSNPHAHNYEAGVKLHLGTGELFDRNNHPKGNIGKKRLTTLRGQIKIPLPPLENGSESKS